MPEPLLARIGATANAPVPDALLSDPLEVLKTNVLTGDELSEEALAKPWLIRRNPLDGGRKYLTISASMITMFLFAALLSTSVLIIPLEEYFHVPRADAALFVSLSLGLFCFTTIFISKIADRIGVFTTQCGALVCLFIAFLIPSFLDNYWAVLVVFVIFGGVGGAGTQMMPMLMSPPWFEPLGRAGAALGITLSAVGAGNVVFTVVLDSFESEFNWRWSLRFTALLILVLGVIATFLATPRRLHANSVYGLTRAAADVFLASAKGGQVELTEERVTSERRAAIAAAAMNGDSEVFSVIECKHPGLDDLTKKVDGTVKGKSTIVVADPCPELADLAPERAILAAADFVEKIEASKPFFVVSMFRRPRFVLFFIACFVGTFNFYAPMVHLVPHGEDIGLTSGDAAFLLVILSIVTIVGRVIAGILADIIGGMSVFAIANVLQMGSFIFWRFAQSPTDFRGVAGLFGVSSAFYIVGTTSTVKQLTLPSELSNGMDFILGVSFAPGASLIGPIMGWVYDAEDSSYDLILTILCIMQAVPLVLTVLMAVVRREYNSPLPPAVRDAAASAAAGAQGDYQAYSTPAAKDSSPAIDGEASPSVAESGGAVELMQTPVRSEGAPASANPAASEGPAAAAAAVSLVEDLTPAEYISRVVSLLHKLAASSAYDNAPSTTEYGAAV